MDDRADEGEAEKAPGVLVVEDEFLLAMEIETCLTGRGFRVIGPVATVAGALDVLDRTRPALAVLDVDLRGEKATPVAAALRARAIPFVLVTGFDRGHLQEVEFAGAPQISKPLDLDRLLATLEAARTPHPPA